MTDSHSGILTEEAEKLGIKVLPMPFYIDDELYLEDDPVYGLFDYLNSEISIRIKKLDHTLCDKEQVFNSFWHEVFHAFNYLYNNEMNESLAQVFANFMREFQSTVKY